MPSIEELKERVQAEIDSWAADAVRVARTILDNPEPGFREHKTARTVCESFSRLGIPFEDSVGITGVKAVLDSGRPGPTVAVIGELDSHIVPGHLHADPETDAAHACGHHAQIGMMLAAASGLGDAEVMAGLSGRIALFAVPAEEYLEIEHRDELRRQGKLEFLGGKAELIRLGALDDVDIAMMTHATAGPEGASFTVGGTNNGMVAKKVRFTGKVSHAGGAPHAGINALNAAMIAMSAIHAQRETYRDEDTIRVHPIITRGGAAVSSVPDDVRMETFVRGKTTEAFLSANSKVDRALRAGAMAVGGSVTIATLPGYMPIQHSPDLLELYRPNAESLVGPDRVVPQPHRTGSTDMGDVSLIMPAIHPYVVAATGSAHGVDFVVDDYELGVVTAGKAMALTVVDLLADGAKRAREIKAMFRPAMTKKAYLSFMRGLFTEETYAG